MAREENYPGKILGFPPAVIMLYVLKDIKASFLKFQSNIFFTNSHRPSPLIMINNKNFSYECVLTLPIRSFSFGVTGSVYNLFVRLSP